MKISQVHAADWTNQADCSNDIPFHQVEPVLFNTRDQRIHQRKKKYLSPAFSAKNLQEYEPYMTGTIGKLMDCLNRQTEVSGHAQIDFNVYCELKERN